MNNDNNKIDPFSGSTTFSASSISDISPALQRLYQEFGSEDPKEIKDNVNLLFVALADNVAKKLLLTKPDWLYLLQNSDLSHKNYQGSQAVDWALAYNSSEELYFDDAQWDLLMPSIDPLHSCAQGFTPLTSLLSTYTSQCHNIGQPHIKNLLSVSRFGRGGHHNMTPLDYALVYNDKTDWLSYENWETLYKKCEFDIKAIDLKFPEKEIQAILARKETFQIQYEKRMLQAELVNNRVPSHNPLFTPYKSRI